MGRLDGCGPGGPDQGCGPVRYTPVRGWDTGCPTLPIVPLSYCPPLSPGDGPCPRAQAVPTPCPWARCEPPWRRAARHPARPTPVPGLSLPASGPPAGTLSPLSLPVPGLSHPVPDTPGHPRSAPCPPCPPLYRGGQGTGARCRARDRPRMVLSRGGWLRPLTGRRPCGVRPAGPRSRRVPGRPHHVPSKNLRILLAPWCIARTVLTTWAAPGGPEREDPP